MLFKMIKRKENVMKKKKRALTIIVCSVIVSALIISGCFGPKGGTVPEKRAYVLKVHNETLEELYTDKPQLEERVENAAGYGVFSNLGAHIFVLSTGNGFGVVVNNKTGQKTYMRMAEIGVGLGIGIKDFRAVFVFHDEKSLDKFVTKGWQWGGEADAAAKSGEKGGAATAAEDIMRGVDVYQFTETGIALSATVSGTKYWRDKKLNKNEK